MFPCKAYWLDPNPLHFLATCHGPIHTLRLCCQGIGQIRNENARGDLHHRGHHGIHPMVITVSIKSSLIHPSCPQNSSHETVENHHCLHQTSAERPLPRLIHFVIVDISHHHGRDPPCVIDSWSSGLHHGRRGRHGHHHHGRRGRHHRDRRGHRVHGGRGEHGHHSSSEQPC